MKTLLHYLFLFCFNILLPTVHSQCIKDQQQSLLHLKKSLQFDQPSCRTPLISWNSSTDCCSWVGVTCTSNGHVTGLDRSRKTISGPILGSFANFSNLRLLDLRGNSISSPISGFFANFSNLRLLDLSENNIRGKIHHWIWSSNRLYTLNLSSNYLVTLEAPLLNSTVKTVDLHLNQLQGQIPTSLPYAKYLDYSRNNFNSIPSNIGNKGLSGFPLTVDNKAGFPPPPTVNGRPPNSGHHREVNWDLIIVEIGFTFGFGVAVGSLVLCKRWSKWYYRAMYNILLKIFPQLEQIIGIHRRHVYIN
ncbi:receptor-like protein 35 [Prunus dulcis]|uniref:receptor-like protein 35 n=1 Tax=Prunus dulcis TaxID=3755 RepID=UPI00148267A0|nr:receptor-like protein 35 [Prunus dulcis]